MAIGAEPAIVLHLAAQALVRPPTVIRSGPTPGNVMGTVHLLEAVRGCPSVEAVVIVTSDKAYENREWPSGPIARTSRWAGATPIPTRRAAPNWVTRRLSRASFFGQGGGIGKNRQRAGGQRDRRRRLVDGPADPGRGAGVRAAGEPVEIRAPGAIRPWQPRAGTARRGICGWPEMLSGPDAGGRYAEGWNLGPADDGLPSGRRGGRGPRPRLGRRARRGGSPPAPTRTRRPSSRSTPRRPGPASAGTGGCGSSEALDWTGAWYRAQGEGADAADADPRSDRALRGAGLRASMRT